MHYLTYIFATTTEQSNNNSDLATVRFGAPWTHETADKEQAKETYICCVLCALKKTNGYLKTGQ